MKKYLAYLTILACAFLVLFVGYINIDAIIGAFGDVPPYYGRTTNMDKWQNPIPTLVTVDVITLVVIFLAGRWAYRQIKSS